MDARADGSPSPGELECLTVARTTSIGCEAGECERTVLDGEDVDSDYLEDDER